MPKTQTFRRGRADQNGIVPGQFSQGLGQLLKPAVVGEPPIKDRRVRAENNLKSILSFWIWVSRFRFYTRRSRSLTKKLEALQFNRLGWKRGAGDQTLMQRRAPEELEIRGTTPLLPVISHHVIARDARLPGKDG